MKKESLNFFFLFAQRLRMEEPGRDTTFFIDGQIDFIALAVLTLFLYLIIYRILTASKTEK